MRQSACGTGCRLPAAGLTLRQAPATRRSIGHGGAERRPMHTRVAAKHGLARKHGGTQNADFTTPPSTRSAAPVVADDSGLAT